MSMLEKFFSAEYEGRGELFEGLSVWEEEKYRELQGIWPVIFLSFAKVKETSFDSAKKRIHQIIARLYNEYKYRLGDKLFNEKEDGFYRKVSYDMEDNVAVDALNALSGYLSQKVLILLDEYDTPMQEAYMGGYWKEMAEFYQKSV